MADAAPPVHPLVGTPNRPQPSQPDLAGAPLQVYAFSAENWRRAPDEVDFILGLLESVLASEVAELATAGVRLRFIGELGMLPRSLQRQIARCGAKEVCGQTPVTVAFRGGLGTRHLAAMWSAGAAAVGVGMLRWQWQGCRVRSWWQLDIVLVWHTGPRQQLLLCASLLPCTCPPSDAHEKVVCLHAPPWHAALSWRLRTTATCTSLWP